MRRPKRWLRVLVAFGANVWLELAWPNAAGATPTFPDVVASRLKLASTPACSLCHAGQPGPGTATTPFAIALQSRGARAYDEASLETALDALTAEKKDSDGDGVPDIDELKAGADPNVAEGDESITPEYGCSSTGSFPRPGTPAVGVLMGLVVSFPWFRRRRRKRTPHEASDGGGGSLPPTDGVPRSIRR